MEFPSSNVRWAGSGLLLQVGQLLLASRDLGDVGVGADDARDAAGLVALVDGARQDVSDRAVLVTMTQRREETLGAAGVVVRDQLERRLGIVGVKDRVPGFEIVRQLVGAVAAQRQRPAGR